MKSTRYQASKVVCNIENFHIEIPVHQGAGEFAKASVLELCQSTQFSVKIPLGGIGSPLQLTLGYIDATTKRYMNAKQLIQLKGYLNLYVSKKNQDPQANIPAEGKIRNEKSYKGRPPVAIKIISNEQNLTGVPFVDEYVYMTFDCKNLELFDDLLLEITAEAKYGIGETQVQKAKDSK